jgi:hypothetical protein
MTDPEMTEREFDLTRRSFIDRVLMATAGAGMAAMAPWASAAVATEPTRSNSVRLGVIGTGDRGRALIQNIAKTRNCTVVAICDTYAPHLAKGRALVDATTRRFADHRAMLDAGGLDAVVIATPLDHACATLPSTRSTPGCTCGARRRWRVQSRIVARWSSGRRAAGKVLQIGHQRMFHPTYLNALKRARGRRDRSRLTQIRASWHRNTSWRRTVPADATTAGSTGACIATVRRG